MAYLNGMNKSILLFAIFFLSSFAFAASEIDKGTALYIKDQMVPINVESMGEVLDKFHQESPTKNIIFFIHGRARHVDEEWVTIPNLEKIYNAKVVMFHWPSWSSLITRPVDRAQESADELTEAFRGIRKYKEAHPEIFLNKKITLLVHSMGHLIMKEFVEHYYAHDLNLPNGEKLFNNYISAGADIPMNDHASWLSRLDFAGEKYVFMNNHDLVLTLSYILDIKDRNFYLFKLGLGFDTTIMKRKRIKRILDPETTYIDLSKSLKREHRYFESEDAFIIHIFKPLMNGQKFSPDKLGSKISVDQGVYYIKR